ncbi:MAG: cytochrome o ubiquinol oxidase subunit III [Verrucomicrobia bacterium]|nr:cytochrome o ubiquinol oxidase subunit III [Verrucomicrobiota bacterium]
MEHPKQQGHELYPDTHHDPYSKTIFGFWLYLLTDFILFGTLFAVYAVLKDSTFGGPSAQDLFSRRFAFFESIVMLTISFTVGLAGAYCHRGNKKLTVLYLWITFLLGALVLWMQFDEFHRVLAQGHSWKNSAFLSAYFSLVGTHSIHIIFGLLWIPVLLVPIWRGYFNFVNLRRITCLKMFWQFLNIVWICIFTIVYLIGVN